MSVEITAVAPESPAQKAGIRPGQRLVEINGQPVGDVLDYEFLLHDETVCLSVRISRGKEKRHHFQKAYGDDLGIRLPPIHPRACGNRCIFCFIDQLPAGMRKSLYLKDEDYRLSFLQGSYITLTGLGENELERIIRQRLSPLYISVHSTDETVRRLMLGRERISAILETIARLTAGRIQMHCQIVICPGINDGAVLTRTVDDLAGFFPAVQSVAIVPVGLTGHRKELYRLKPVGPTLARRILAKVEERQSRFRQQMGCGFIYPADELFLLAGRSIPKKRYYDDFPQLENGVGMVRHFLDLFEERQLDYPDRLPQPRTITLVTGQLAAPILRRTMMTRLSRINGLKVHLRAVPNRFFGGGVTVSGLLTGRDIVQHLSDHPCRGTLLLPPNCLNEDGLFLDDLSPKDVERRLGLPVRVCGRHDPLEAIQGAWL